MAILVGSETRLLVQGLGRDGSFQASSTRAYGTNMVAAVHPGRAGQKFEDNVPFFSQVADAVEQTGANTGVIFVPAPFAMDAIIEQVDAGLELVVCITEGVPVIDMVKGMAYIKDKPTRFIVREIQSRHHSQQYRKTRECRCCFAVWNSYLRSNCTVGAAWTGSIHMRRDWWRPCPRNNIH